MPTEAASGPSHHLLMPHTVPRADGLGSRALLSPSRGAGGAEGQWEALRPCNHQPASGNIAVLGNLVPVICMHVDTQPDPQTPPKLACPQEPPATRCSSCGRPGRLGVRKWWPSREPHPWSLGHPKRAWKPCCVPTAGAVTPLTKHGPQARLGPGARQTCLPANPSCTARKKTVNETQLRKTMPLHVWTHFSTED